MFQFNHLLFEKFRYNTDNYRRITRFQVKPGLGKIEIGFQTLKTGLERSGSHENRTCHQAGTG